MLKKNNLNKLYILFLTFFSIFFNQYYGYIGILPIDSFLIFNSGFDLMNGYLPFKDYWTIKEPFIDLLQATFFKIIGVSWFAYVLHASIFNFIITISTYFFFQKVKIRYQFLFFLLSMCCNFNLSNSWYSFQRSSCFDTLFVVIVFICFRSLI